MTRIHPAGSGDAGRLRARLRWLGALPAAAGLITLAVGRLLGGPLPGEVIVWSVWGALAGIAVFGRGHRLLRRACTTGLRRISAITARVGSSHPIDDHDLDELLEAARELELALAHRVFGLIPLARPGQAHHLLADLRRARTGQPLVIGDPAFREIAELKEKFMRWVDAVA
ncbi:hypothetical protein [Streptomyces sp. NBC_01304]|uniref:hypothetical protein n=1 Tax=Streptomyces sp. NBC_01304 TaxID=2903818 RepID=UPI002E0D91A8|nr:hypothetical protein OG430_48280 [Streptomyces sp. NBC_01304]